MALQKKPPPASPELLYTVRNGISGTRLTKPLTTLAEADAAAIKISATRLANECLNAN